MKQYSIFSLLALVTMLIMPAHADLIKQSSGYSRTVLMTSSTDHISGATGLTLVVKIAKAGGSYSSISPTVTEQSGGTGRYTITLTTGNTDTLGALDLQVTAIGADPSDTHDQIVAFDPTSATNLGLTNLDAAVSTRNSVTPPTVTAIRQEMDANSTKLDVAVSTRNSVAPDNTSIATILTRTDVATSTRLATSGYTVSPTVTAIRTEMDTNSTKLGNLDAAISTRLASSGYTVPPTASQNATAVWGFNLFTGFTVLTGLQDIWGTSTGPSTATYPDATHQTTHYFQPDGTTGQHSTGLVTNSSGKAITRTYTSP